MERSGTLRRPRRWLALASAAVAALATAGLLSGLASRGDGSPPPPPVLGTAVVERANLAITESFTATVGFGPVRVVTGTGPGTITGLPAQGSVVRRGQALYRVDDQPVVLFYGSTAMYRVLGLPPGSVPGSKPPASVVSARATLRAARLQVKGDETALAQARALAASSGLSTLIQDRARLTGARSALAAAEHTLALDRSLGCSGLLTGAGTGAGAGTGSSSNTVGAGNLGDAGTVTGAGAPGTKGDAGPGTGAGTAVGNQTAGSPIVSTESATAVSAGRATLSATVDPRGLSTSAAFQYGTSAAYGHTVPATPVGPGGGPLQMSAVLTGLSASTTYVFRLVAANAAGTTTGPASTFTTPAGPCSVQHRAVEAARGALVQARLALEADQVNVGATVAADAHQLAVDQLAERQDTRALQAASSQLHLPSEKGQDVALVARNLAALGYLSAAQGSGRVYTAALAGAVRRWQAAEGLPVTGNVTPGQVVVAPGPLRVASVTAQTGEAARSNILTFTGTSKRVSFVGTGSLHIGQGVTVELPGGRTVAAHITALSQLGGKLQVRAFTPDQVALPSTGQVPVRVVTAEHRGVLVAPVEALVALSGGGYALEHPNGRLTAVTIGLISNDQVQVQGRGLRAGMRVVTAV